MTQQNLTERFTISITKKQDDLLRQIKSRNNISDTKGVSRVDQTRDAVQQYIDNNAD